MGKLLNEIVGYKYKLNFADGLSFTEDKIKLIHDFIKLCINHLELSEHFTVRLVLDREKHGIKTTAFYRNSDGLICVYAKNRMLGDILRSVAHELVHKKQYEEDRINYPIQDIGGENEDEANSVAGVLVKLFLNKDTENQKIFESRVR